MFIESLSLISLLFTPPQSALPLGLTTGVQEIAFIPVDNVQDGNHLSLAELEFGFSGSPNSIANFFLEASYGQLTLVPTFTPWILTSSIIEGCYLDSSMVFDLSDPYIDFLDYHRYLIYLYDDNTNCSSGSSGFGYEALSTPEGIIKASYALIRSSFHFPNDFSQTTQSTIAHELHHSLGINYHANAYLCGDEIYSTDFADCHIGSRGDVFDIMGLRSQASHPNIVLKERLGWLGENNILEAKHTGTYRIHALESPEDNVKGIRILLPNPLPMIAGIDTIRDIQYLYIEYRGMTGFDQRSLFYRTITQADGGSFLIENIHGALIRAVSCVEAGCHPYLLDMHPDSLNPSYPPNESADAYLYLGETFSIPLNSIEIETVAVEEGNYIDVNVTYTGSKQFFPDLLQQRF